MTETPAATDGRSDAKLTHIINGIWPLFGGLIFWLISKDKSAFADSQGKEATNFGINLAIALTISWILASLLFWLVIPLLLPVGVWVYGLVMGIKAGGEAEKGVEFAYPICPLRLIK